VSASSAIDVPFKRRPPFRSQGADDDGHPSRSHQEKATRTPAHLSRKVIRLDVPEKDREDCVQMNVRISEVYRHQPAKRYVVRYERPQYVDPKDPSRDVKVAPLPPLQG